MQWQVSAAEELSEGSEDVRDNDEDVVDVEFMFDMPSPTLGAHVTGSLQQLPGRLLKLSRIKQEGTMMVITAGMPGPA